MGHHRVILNACGCELVAGLGGVSDAKQLSLSERPVDRQCRPPIISKASEAGELSLGHKLFSSKYLAVPVGGTPTLTREPLK
eukprot:scaffold318778_cov63-Attheya_sp.AAC.3